MSDGMMNWLLAGAAIIGLFVLINNPHIINNVIGGNGVSGGGDATPEQVSTWIRNTHSNTPGWV